MSEPLTTPELIIGLNIDVTGAELKQILEDRHRHHTHRLAVYQKQLVEMEKANAALDEDARSIGKGSIRTPVDEIKQAIQRHSNQTVYYRFVADHLVMDAVYRLSESELVRLGIQSDRY